MRLSRRIERSLGDGASVSVLRDWRVRFVRQGRGIAITGEQVSATVDAPPSLASLADIERRRATDGMWPILLSGDGRIEAAGTGLREEDVDLAIGEAQRVLEGRTMLASDRAEVLRVLSQIHRASSSTLERLPADLFYPDGEPRHSSRQLQLSQDLSGTFDVQYEATASAGGGWLKEARRLVVTRIGDSERRAGEWWTLSPE